MQTTKDDTYLRAGMLLEDQIRSTTHFLAKEKYLQYHYPYDENGDNISNDPDISRDEMDETVVRLTSELRVLEEKRGHVKEVVEDLVSTIYTRMSYNWQGMSRREIWKLTGLIKEFMQMTGNPWICNYRHVVLFYDFLIETWSDAMILKEREDVWTRVPEICAEFMLRTSDTRAESKRRMHERLQGSP